MPPRAINFLFIATLIANLADSSFIYKKPHEHLHAKSNYTVPTAEQIFCFCTYCLTSQGLFSLLLNPNPCLQPEICGRLWILFMLFTIPSMKKSTLILAYSDAFLHTQNKCTPSIPCTHKYSSQWPPCLMTKIESLDIQPWNRASWVLFVYLFFESIMFKMLPI